MSSDTWVTVWACQWRRYITAHCCGCWLQRSIQDQFKKCHGFGFQFSQFLFYFVGFLLVCHLFPYSVFPPFSIFTALELNFPAPPPSLSNPGMKYVVAGGCSVALPRAKWHLYKTTFLVFLLCLQSLLLCFPLMSQRSCFVSVWIVLSRSFLIFAPSPASFVVWT